MLEVYNDFINDHITQRRDFRPLIAASGGVDSMVLLHLAVLAGDFCAIAHVNHHTRGVESDQDAALVEGIVQDLALPYHQLDLDPKEIGKANFQEKARTKRYQWWQQLCNAHNYTHILTAHHADDGVETFLINLSRSSGLKGLLGIPQASGNILRPLSSISKRQIQEYALQNSIAYREDASNQSNDYLRNSIRNQWIPLMERDVPHMKNAIAGSIHHLQSVSRLLDELAQNQLQNALYQDDQGRTHIRIDKLDTSSKAQLLYYHLAPLGFTLDSVSKAVSASIGAIFYSEEYEMLRDRYELIYRKKRQHNIINMQISSAGNFYFDTIDIEVSDHRVQDNSLEIRDLHYPFVIRHWKDGDTMKPTGMSGKSKKIKDLLTDLKIDRWKKKETLVLEKDNKIVAALPYRIAVGYDDKTANTCIHISLTYK